MHLLPYPFDLTGLHESPGVQAAATQFSGDLDAAAASRDAVSWSG